MTDQSLLCPVCGGEAGIVTRNQPGYQRPQVFSIVRCSQCGASHALPLETSSAVYELIYSQSEIVPGYERYARYARGVERASDPLEYIGAQEDVYWAVREYLRGRDPKATGPVLEIGCGLGYLTYAMRRRGYDATGIDLSHEAIARAIERYGPYYEAADVITLAGTEPARFDLIVMTEVIEHLPDFYAVLRAIVALLRTGGEAVITTPNRSAFGPGLIWETDPPPIHLWWFTEDAMREIAGRLGVAVRFTDFTAFNTTYAPLLPDANATGVTRGAMFDEGGKMLVASAPVRRFVPIGRIYDAIAKSRARGIAKKNAQAGRPDPQNGRRGTLCAVFSAL